MARPRINPKRMEITGITDDLPDAAAVGMTAVLLNVHTPIEGDDQ